MNELVRARAGAPGLGRQARLHYAPRGMPLVARIILGVAAVLALCIGGGTFLVHQIVTAKFSATESELVLRNRSVVQQAVASAVDYLRFTVNDWSQWDDFHNYAQGRNPGFATSELGERALQRLNLDALLVLGPAGEVVRADFAAGTGVRDAATASFVKALESKGSDGDGTLLAGPVAGLLDTPAGTMALAAETIRRTDGSGDPAGVLVMARRLDPQQLSRELSVLPAEVRLVTGTNISPELHAMVVDLGRAGESARLLVRERDLADYQFFRDINGKPAFLLESRMTRSIAATGREATRLIAIVAVAGAAVALVTLVVVLRQLVTLPIARLTSHILEMRTDPSDRPVPGCAQGDEVGTLAQEFDALIRARQADEALLSRLAAAVEHAGDAIALMDTTGHIIYVNPQYERQTGRTAAEVLGRGPSHGTSPPEVYAELWAAVDRGEEWHGLLQSRRKNGSLLLGDVTVAPIRGTDGEVTSYVAVMRDVTDSQQAAAEIRKLAAAVENAAEAIVVLNHEGRIEYCNPAYERQRQLSLAQLYGRHPSDLGRGLDDPEHYANIWRAVQLGGAWSGEINTERLDGKRLVEEVVLSPIRDQGGTVTHYVGVLHDVTGRRQLEAQLTQVRRLEAIGQLAAGVAHEINTPIQYVGDNIRFLRESFGAVAGLVDHLGRLAADKAGAGLTAAELARAFEEAEVAYLRHEVPAAIEQSLEGVSRVAEIVRSMKELAHPARDLVAVDLNRVISGAVTVASPEWKPVAELVLQLDPSLPAVPCLPGSINQVVVNMLVNATHAIAEQVSRGGAPGRITVSTRVAGPWAEIEIQDNGAGMTAEVQERVFDPFFTTKPVGKGTGQGMAIAHAVIKKHGGEVAVRSEPGQGAVFTVRLPLQAAAGSRAAAA